MEPHVGSQITSVINSQRKQHRKMNQVRGRVTEMVNVMREADAAINQS